MVGSFFKGLFGGGCCFVGSGNLWELKFGRNGADYRFGSVGDIFRAIGPMKSWSKMMFQNGEFSEKLNYLVFLPLPEITSTNIICLSNSIKVLRFNLKNI